MTGGTWLDLPADTGFGLGNLPYGVFSTPGTAPRTGVAIGDQVLDLAAATGDDVHATGTLNAFLARGPEAWSAVRAQVTDWFTDAADRDVVEPHLVRREEVTMHLPVEVADYVDFYSSQHHAENLGRMFRPDSAALTPNWKHLPIGYHGRAGTVQVSGTPVVRPCGQRKAPADEAPTFGPSARLDIEAEVGFVCGGPVASRLTPARAVDHVFGVALVNDWSARDIQAWEYQPLGPFLGKSFATSVSAWITPLEAFAVARVTPPPLGNDVLPYLVEDQAWGLDIDIEVEWNGTVVSRPPFRGMSWTFAQQLAHLSANGATVRPGDLIASGTVSGPDRDQRGSFLELSWGGKEPVVLDGGERTFLEDGDTVRITATAPGEGGSVVGLAEVVGTIAPADER